MASVFIWVGAVALSLFLLILSGWWEMLEVDNVVRAQFWPWLPPSIVSVSLRGFMLAVFTILFMLGLQFVQFVFTGNWSDKKAKLKKETADSDWRGLLWILAALGGYFILFEMGGWQLIQHQWKCMTFELYSAINC